jgi:catechol 2,3-dioxygenase-like lactoylglutathione lyase family enzyme
MLTTSAMVVALHHVNVTVPTELEAPAKHFYAVVLGLKQIPKPSTSRQSGAWFEIGETQLHLSVEDESRGQLSSGHICFAISDLAEAEQRFREAGVEIIPDPRPNPASPRYYVRDPGGNLLEIAQQK